MSTEKLVKNGKVPLANRGKNIGEFYLGAPKSDFDVPEECLNELKGLKYSHRWIDINQLKKMGNQHRQGWVPFKFKCLSGKSKDNPFLDISLDGFLVRKGMVLAVKTQEAVDQQKSFVKRRTLAQSNAGKNAIDTFKEFAKDEKAVKVHSGYDTDDGSDLT